MYNLRFYNYRLPAYIDRRSEIYAGRRRRNRDI